MDQWPQCAQFQWTSYRPPDTTCTPDAAQKGTFKKKKRNRGARYPNPPPFPPTHLSFASPPSPSFFLIVPSVPLSSEHSDTETQKIQLLCQQISKLGPSQGHIITQNRAFTWNSPSTLDHHTAEPAGYIPCFLTTLNLKKCVAINWQNQSMLYEHFWPPLQKKKAPFHYQVFQGEKVAPFQFNAATRPQKP